MCRDELIRRYGLFMVVPYLIITATIYALIYKGLASMNSQSFQGLGSTNHMVDFLYFSITTISTTGYGDIHPLSTTAKIVAGTEIISGIAIVAYTIISYVKIKVSDKKSR